MIKLGHKGISFYVNYGFFGYYDAPNTKPECKFTRLLDTFKVEITGGVFRDGIKVILVRYGHYPQYDTARKYLKEKIKHHPAGSINVFDTQVLFNYRTGEMTHRPFTYSAYGCLLNLNDEFDKLYKEYPECDVDEYLFRVLRRVAKPNVINPKKCRYIDLNYDGYYNPSIFKVFKKLHDKYGIIVLINVQDPSKFGVDNEHLKSYIETFIDNSSGEWKYYPYLNSILLSTYYPLEPWNIKDVNEILKESIWQ